MDIFQRPGRRDEMALETRRFQAVHGFKNGEPQASLARRLGVSRQAVHKWWRAYHRAGPEGLKRRSRPGRPPKLAHETLATVPTLLRQGATSYGFSTSLWTTQRVAQLIWQRFRVRYDRDHVCRLLHALGFSWQKPTKQAVERNEKVIARWVRSTWPQIKKKPKK